MVRPIAHHRWTPILPTLPIPEGTRPRVMVYTSQSRDDYQVILRSDLAKDYDFQIIEIKQGPFISTIIVNIYNNTPANGEAKWMVERLRRVTLPIGLPTIITGDWNAHQPWWEPKHFKNRDEEPTRHATDLAEWLNAGC